MNGCSNRECHKTVRRKDSLIRMLRAELEAARGSIEEAEREIAELDAALLDTTNAETVDTLPV